MSKLSNDLRNLFNKLNIPKNKILLVHLKLKNIIDKLELKDIYPKINYSELSDLIIKILKEELFAKGIVVPSFTYSFTKKGIFNKLEMKSEVGRFGEEVRVQNKLKRIFDPVFSVIDCHSILPESKYHNIQLSAFGSGSIWEYLSEKDCYILNVNLDELISTHLHYLEFKKNVPYRFNKDFFGKVSETGIEWQEIKYTYYVRQISLDTKWRRSKIEKDLLKKGDNFQSFSYKGINLKAFSTSCLNQCIGKLIENDPYYLINNI